MSDDHESYELTLTMIMTILTHSDMIHNDLDQWSWILRANPDDDHGEDPGVDKFLHPVADGVDGEDIQTWIIVIMSYDHEFYELTLTMIMAKTLV